MRLDSGCVQEMKMNKEDKMKDKFIDELADRINMINNDSKEFISLADVEEEVIEYMRELKGEIYNE